MTMSMLLVALLMSLNRARPLSELGALGFPCATIVMTVVAVAGIEVLLSELQLATMKERVMSGAAMKEKRFINHHRQAQFI